MSSFTLDDIREAAEAKYGSTTIDLGGFVVNLLNPIRLRADKRAELTRIQRRMTEASPGEGEEIDEEVAAAQAEEQLDLLRQAIRAVCETTAQADALLDKVGHDGGLLIAVFEKYNSQEKPGEA